MSIDLERTDDILGYLGQHKKDHQILCGFSMETENMLENSQKKLVSKNVDMIAANNLKEMGAGFQTDTNRLTLITQEDVVQMGLQSKEEAANGLLNFILKMREKRNW